MSQLTIYKASAGSGKTYKLTEEYILLLFKSAFNYRRILAVTFTNKATAEMKSRILNELYKLSTGEKSGYLQSIKNEFNLTENEIRVKSRQILSSILHDFSKFSINTIDTFFQKIIRSFTREVGIQPGYTVELDHNEVLNKVVDELLLDLESNKELREWLVNFALTNIEEGSKWDFKNDILKLAQEIFKEEYKSFDQALIKKMNDKAFLKDYLNKLQEIKAKFENTLKAFGKQGLQIIEKNGLTIEDFSYGKSGVAGYFINISEKNDFEPRTRAISGTESIDPWIKKDSPKKEIIENALHNGLFELLLDAIHFYNENHVDYYTSLNILRFIHTLGILTDIANKLRSYCEEQGIFLISDAGRLLQIIIDTNDSPFIYEKTGSIYKHFMIDEFQDTSRIQWNNFKPLIGNSLAEGNNNLLVGDVKQSIYRWRNSDWKILSENVNNDFSQFTPDLQSLKINWRSKKKIIAYNNAAFWYSSTILQNHFNEQLPKSNPGFENKIVNAYSDIIQQNPEGMDNDGGYVHHTFFKDSEFKEWKTEVKNRVPKLIENLQDKGFRLNDIAVLVRRGSEGQEIADTLIQYKNSLTETTKYRFDFISNDSLFLVNSTVIPFILSVLNFLLDPGDDINTAYLAWNYQKNIINTEPVKKDSQAFPESFLHEKDNQLQKSLPSVFLNSLDLLKQLPLFELTDQIIKIFNLNQLKQDIPYLQAFQDIVLNFSRNKSADIHTFIEWWNEKGFNETLNISENQDAIRIITIHKSKGLEFKAVIIPFCNWEIDHKPSQVNILWCKPEKEPFNKLELIPVKYKSELTKTIFSDAYFNEKLHAYVDNLNLLYVAFTRAEQALFTFSQVKEKSKSPSTVGELLHFVYQNTESFPKPANNELINFTESFDKEKSILEFGELEYFSEKPKDLPEEIMMNDYPFFEIQNKLRLKLHDNYFFTGKENTPFKRVSHGKIMHEIFENINTEKDIPDAIEKMTFEGKISGNEKNDISEKINQTFKNEQIKSWFSDKWLVKPEREILLKNGKIARPDRVLIGKEKIIVIDYKFGEQEEEKHYKQVRTYMDIIKEMHNKPVEGYLWYVDLGIIKAGS
ncbi:MAG: hypothetical protein A2X13_01965 [Bacteroidetes bacterium GWC2_33_15]|nr:MAG: hypothetical protein A2X10_07660 [Bacteroidetes bacterium GWA2_33_15]OFX52245.1 MAG: hypothetical protein A2X13_01965 [Bacteroidetes bacterium GWC2_33_15]OFX64399.1 MAG: hypothetical protein A2X15_12785 [Bacteroidetes bacterium GWB2_32_14]OFX67804.1 MAG: hypothetical protein A2X14_06610 [Bacteroidetes bacterium GWD2_33_33]HAN19417.1 ATP-dependent helicase [Bacteroidales bacterium]